jgi:type II secretory pathway predicted ATPase ExeA
MLLYRDFYGIRSRPFPITPNPRFLYLSTGHQEALAHLLYALVDGGGFVLLTGEVGTGKTSICRYALEQMPENVDIALIVNPDLSKIELVATLCDEFGVAGAKEAGSLKAALDLLYAYLIDANAKGRHSIVMIDEAQNLRPEVLEQLRLLTNLETDTRKLLQIILVGQPELNGILRRHELRQLDQRIGSRYHLRPLSQWETAAYVGHRLAVAGARREIFTPDALVGVHRHSRGVPRIINLLCDRCLLGGYAEGAAVVSSDIVEQAASELSPWSRSSTRPSLMSAMARFSPTKAARLPLLLGLLVFLGGFAAVTGLPTLESTRHGDSLSKREAEPSRQPAIRSLARLGSEVSGKAVLELDHLAADIGSPVQAEKPVDAKAIGCAAGRVAVGDGGTDGPRPAKCGRVDLAEYPRM